MTDEKFRAEVRAEIAADIAGRKLAVVSLDDQIKFQRLEIESRQRTLGHLLASGRIRHDEMERELSNWWAVLVTLEQVQRGQRFRREG
jgi:hypothetical protein